jgi:hypothetical protein
MYLQIPTGDDTLNKGQISGAFPQASLARKYKVFANTRFNAYMFSQYHERSTYMTLGLLKTGTFSNR